MRINKNAIRLKVGQTSTSSTTLNVDENQFIKSQGTQTINTSGVQSLFDDSKLVDDYFLKGSYKVVSDIDCRNNIPCEYRKLGMQVMVVGPDASFKRYVLKGNDPCSNEGWEEVLSTTNEVDVKLVEDYSVLGDYLNTQRDLNLKLKQSILNLQTQVNNIELIDEKVQITEDTSFAQIGESQKDVNKNVSDYKINADLKNQEQDDRLTALEGEDVSQNDIINGLQTALDNKVNKNPEIVSSTKTKVTYDSKGLVIDGDDATTIDINDSIDRRYVTDVQLNTIQNTSGINTGDETTLSIQTKRPLKTINNESLEGSGNVQINYNDLDNLPTIVNDKNYVHNQIVASNFWEIQHNLDKYPSVSIIDSGNNLVVGEIKYIDSNNIIITFTSVFSGKAYFN